MASPIKIGRTVAGLYAREVRRNSDELTVRGMINAADVDSFRAARANLGHLEEGQVVPLTHAGDPELDGFYEVSSVTTDDSPGTRAGRAGTKFEATLLPMGLIGWRSRLGGANLVTGHTVTPAPFVGFPVAATDLLLSPVGTVYDRTGADGAAAIARSASRTSYAWACPPSSWLRGAATISWVNDSGDTTRYTRDGLWVPGVPAGPWELSNGLVRLREHTTAGFLFGIYNGATWSEWAFELIETVGGAAVALEAGTRVAVLQNQPHIASIRFAAPRSATAGGFNTLTLEIRRGSRFISGHWQRDASTQLGIKRSAVDAATSTSDGCLATTTAVTGYKWLLCSPSGLTFDTTNGRINLSSGSTNLRFAVGGFPDAGPPTGDARGDVVAQYHGAVSEAITPRPL